MYNSPFYTPGFNPNMMSSNMLRGVAGSGLMNGTRGIGAASNLANGARGAGLLSRLGTGLSSIKKINWGGLINNTSKTLGIINQTIPLVRQVGPMVNNMRSMLKIASIFKDETDTPKRSNSNQTTTNSTTTPTTSTNPNTTLETNSTNQTHPNSKTIDYNESPTFFINT